MNAAVASSNPPVCVIGAGPAGLRAAEVLAEAGLQVDVFDAMPSVGRKFLLAGRGGLNLTHSEPPERFLHRYGDRRPQLLAPLAAFDAEALRGWAHGLGVDTFVGSSGRVFPSDLKAAPLLRAWLHRLRALGVRFHMRHRWLGFGGTDQDAAGAAAGGRARLGLVFQSPAGEVRISAPACVLALGGASWARLGSDGAWVPVLQEAGVDVAPLRPSNCGFQVSHLAGDGQEAPGWTPHFAQRHAGAALKNVAISFQPPQGPAFAQRGEFVVTEAGVEGSLVYAASAWLRDEIERQGRAVFQLDLLPMHSAEHVAAEVARPRGSRSLSTHLKARLGLADVKAALLRELLTKAQMADPPQLARGIKALPVTVVAARPIDEAISSAGGVRFSAMDGRHMLAAAPGVFCAGEMLDWEAPTGGYLLTACMATGGHAARGVVDYLQAAARG
jgi:uncharacterized flavoprotein (TIGR03862 family)